MTGFCIGQVNIDGRFIMAPMAGVTDRAFRQICRECGAAATISEMISTQALLFQDKKTKDYTQNDTGGKAGLGADFRQQSGVYGGRRPKSTGHFRCAAA